MRFIIFLGLLVTLLLSACGSDEAVSNSESTAPTTSPVPDETSSRSDESKLINELRAETLTAVDRARTAALMSAAALPNATNDKLIKVNSAYSEYRAKIEKYEAKSVADLSQYIATEAKTLSAALLK